MAWLAVALPLLMAGVFRPAPAFALFVPVAAVVLWLGLRSRPREEPGPVPWWTTGSVLAITVAFLVLQVVMVSEQIVVRRDPASYVQFATWLTEHGSLPIPRSVDAFGGPDGVLAFESPAFYADGGAIVPQFMAGMPLVLALGGWLGGTHGILLMAPLLGACCVLAFAGLVARLVGARWAPAGALLLALTLPMLYVSRSTFSELPAIVLLLGGLSLMVDMRRDEGRVADLKAFLAALALGLIVLVRIDGLRDVLPVLAFASLLIGLRRHRVLGGRRAAARRGRRAAESFTLSRPYLRYLDSSIKPLLAISAAVLVATAVMAVLLRSAGRARGCGGWARRSRADGCRASPPDSRCW